MNGRWRIAGWMFVAALWLGGMRTAQAQFALPRFDAAGTNGLPIDLRADHMDFDRAAGVVRASGNVVARRGQEEMRADQASVDMKTHDVRAFGNVVFRKPGTEWKGERLLYNFVTKRWESDAFVSYIAPFHVTAQESSKTSDVEYVLHDVTLTTCSNELEEAHYTICAREVSVIPGERLVAKGVVVYFDGCPAFYSPYWYRRLDDLYAGLSLRPGYRSRMGAFLLSSYAYKVNPYLKAVTELDYRTERGVAGGEELRWKDGETLDGDLSFYYAYDKGVNKYDGGAPDEALDKSRYRIRFDHRQTLDSRSYVLSQVHYLSDNQFLEDFFDHEYRDRYEPDNYVSVAHREDDYTATLLVQKRLNDFFTKVDRLPEASLDFQQQQIPGTPLFYEGQTAAGYLQKLWAESLNESDYSAARVDSRHTLSYPNKYFGFLNFIPRAGYRATYYSKTKGEETLVTYQNVSETNFIAGPGGVTNPVVTTVTTTNSTTQGVEKGADLRSLVELGFETSFRAFRVWEDMEGDGIEQLRHVVEPYARYTFVPTPNLRPGDLYQFDSIDSLDEQHNVTFGTRNKFQTKRDGRSYDLVDVDLFTTYNIRRAEGQKDFSDIFTKTELRTIQMVDIDFDGAFNPYEKTIDQFNTQVTLHEVEGWKSFVEYRYLKDDSSLLTGDVSFSPNRDWTFETYSRFEFKSSRLEEQKVSVQRILDCLGLRLGVGYIPAYTREDGVHRNADFRVIAEFWLTAFPNMRFGSEDRS